MHLQHLPLSTASLKRACAWGNFAQLKIMVIERWSKFYANFLAKEMNKKAGKRKMPNKKTMIHAHEFTLKAGKLHAKSWLFHLQHFLFHSHPSSPGLAPVPQSGDTRAWSSAPRRLVTAAGVTFDIHLERTLWFRGCKSQSLFNFSKVDSSFYNSTTCDESSHNLYEKTSLSLESQNQKTH